jgi:polyisoprenoid-binding protein YceI
MLLGLAPRADAAAAVETPGLVLAPGASLELFGDSTLHHYTVKASEMTVGVGVDSAPHSGSARSLDPEVLVRNHFIKTFDLTVPVAKLSSGEKGLDANLRKALKGDQYKDIRFRMESYDVLAPTLKGAAFALVLHGRLSLAGVERKIDVDASGVRAGAGLRLTGSKDLLMTDYQIKPPTMMLGTIKTANLITVKFNATLQNGQSP